jgi:hypothetical protein
MSGARWVFGAAVDRHVVGRSGDAPRRHVMTRILHGRDARLVLVLGEIYRERSAEEAVIIAWSARRRTSRGDGLPDGDSWFRMDHVEWLMVANASS